MATLKQEKAAKLALENLGSGSPKTKGEILLEAGYSEAMAKNPEYVWETKGFQEILEQQLPDKLLITKHLEGLEATSLYGKDAEEHEDYATRFRYLESAYKLRGKYPTDSVGNKTLIINITSETASRYGLLPKSE